MCASGTCYLGGRSENGYGLHVCLQHLHDLYQCRCVRSLVIATMTTKGEGCTELEGYTLLGTSESDFGTGTFSGTVQCSTQGQAQGMHSRWDLARPPTAFSNPIQIARRGILSSPRTGNHPTPRSHLATQCNYAQFEMGKDVLDVACRVGEIDGCDCS